VVDRLFFGVLRVFFGVNTLFYTRARVFFHVIRWNFYIIRVFYTGARVFFNVLRLFFGVLRVSEYVSRTFKAQERPNFIEYVVLFWWDATPMWFLCGKKCFFLVWCHPAGIGDVEELWFDFTQGWNHGLWKLPFR
jgi:hypothetical protein